MRSVRPIFYFLDVAGAGEGLLLFPGCSGLAFGSGFGGSGAGKVAARLGICSAVRNAEDGKKALN